MNSNAGKPDNPFEWAAWEYQRDLSYWKDRYTHGTGLIKEIAVFVLEQGGKP